MVDRGAGEPPGEIQARSLIPEADRKREAAGGGLQLRQLSEVVESTSAVRKLHRGARQRTADGRGLGSPRRLRGVCNTRGEVRSHRQTTRRLRGAKRLRFWQNP